MPDRTCGKMPAYGAGGTRFKSPADQIFHMLPNPLAILGKNKTYVSNFLPPSCPKTFRRHWTKL